MRDCTETPDLLTEAKRFERFDYRALDGAVDDIETFARAIRDCHGVNGGFAGTNSGWSRSDVRPPAYGEVHKILSSMNTQQLLAGGSWGYVEASIGVVDLTADSFEHKGRLLRGERVHPYIRVVIRMMDQWNANRLLVPGERSLMRPWQARMFAAQQAHALSKLGSFEIRRQSPGTPRSPRRP